MNIKKILVTGGAGLIGLEVCRQLCEAGHHVNLFDLGEQIDRVKMALPKKANIHFGSILDLSSLRASMQECDIVIHLAALLGVKRSEKNKLRCIEININGTKNVLDCAIQHNINKIVFASSSETYGEPLENPIKETSITQGKTIYAITKLAGEEMCKAYAQIYPINYTILRYFNCYGPYQTAQFVVPNFIKNVMKGKPPVIFGDGRQVRSYTFVSDTAEATILAALSDKTNGEIFNIGNGENPVSLKKLASLILRLNGQENELELEIRNNFENSDRTRDREIFERFCDSTKFMRLFEWNPKVSLEEGIKKVMDVGIIFDKWADLYDELT